MIKVGLIDDDPGDRRVIRTLLTQCADGQDEVPVEIIFEESHLPDGDLEVLNQSDIILVDIHNQPDCTVADLDTRCPHSNLIILTHIADPNAVRDCFRNGAVSYLLKSDYPSYLALAVSITFDQGSFVSPDICRSLVEQAYLRKKYEDVLTQREQQVARGIVEGMSYKMIAGQYNISLDTVRAYVKRVYRKLKINSKSELMAQSRF